ncbi:MAG: DUF1801 domain-containing protein [Bacteroidota bacterium]|nr:DUF1801 domain-containing protein [Bacteroidota bacterium]
MRSVDEYIAGLPEDRQVIINLVRKILAENVPGLEEKLSFKIPFYHYFGMFIYINSTKQGIDLAFCRGKDLLNEFPQLELKNRAMATTVCIRNKKDIDALQVRQMIVVAAAWNKEARRLKIPIVKKRNSAAGRSPNRKY